MKPLEYIIQSENGATSVLLSSRSVPELRAMGENVIGLETALNGKGPIINGGISSPHQDRERDDYASRLTDT